MAASKIRRCPHCAEVVRWEASVCQYCGRELAPRELLEQGIAAAKAGRRSEARELLRQVTRQGGDNEKAWLWLSGAVDTDQERQRCLERVLAINPNNASAQRGLEILRQRKGERRKMSSTRWIVIALLLAANVIVIGGLGAVLLPYLRRGFPTHPSAVIATTDTTTTSTTVLTPAPPTPTPTRIPAGRTITVDNWEIRVERIEISETITSPSTNLRYNAFGRYALLFMDVTNRGLRTGTFEAFGNLEIEDAEGRRYEENSAVSGAATSIYGTDTGGKVSPEATAHVVVGFDISTRSSWYRLMHRYREESGSILLDIP